MTDTLKGPEGGSLAMALQTPQEVWIQPTWKVLRGMALSPLESFGVFPSLHSLLIFN